jgi:hypothetical protein
MAIIDNGNPSLPGMSTRVFVFNANYLMLTFMLYILIISRIPITSWLRLRREPDQASMTDS